MSANMETRSLDQIQQEAFDHLLKGRYRMALPLAEKLIKENKNNSEVCVCYAWALLENSDPVNAEKYMNLSKEQPGDSMIARMYRAYLQMRLSSFEGAIYDFNMTEGKQKELLAWTYLNKAKSLSAIGETEKANNFFTLALMIDNNTNPEWKKLRPFFTRSDELRKGNIQLTSENAKELIELGTLALKQKEYWFSFYSSQQMVSIPEIVSEHPEVELLFLESMYKLNQLQPSLERIEMLKRTFPDDEKLKSIELAVKTALAKKDQLNDRNEISKDESIVPHKNTRFFPNSYADVFSFKVFDFLKDNEAKAKKILSAVDLGETRQIGVEIIFNNPLFNKSDQDLKCFLAWYLDDDLVDQMNFVLNVPKDWDAMILTRAVDTGKNRFWGEGEAKVEMYVNKEKAAEKHFVIKKGAEEEVEEKEGKSSEKEKAEIEALDINEVFNELNSIIGLGNVKKAVKELIDYLEFMKERKQLGLKSKDQVTVHSVFLGNPGTGKTTVARLMGKIFKGMGLLSKGEVIEVDRAALVGQYVGETAQKTEKLIEQAIGNVLFIDEAYTLVKKGAGSDFGQEAIDVLLKRMEDKKGEFFVITAGYPKEMQDFLDANPGLRSRFTHTFMFDDYSPDELLEIFNKLVKEEDYRISEEAEKTLLKELTKLYRSKDKNFGNARAVRKIFEDLKIEVSKRYLSLPKHEKTQEKLTSIYPEDIKTIFSPNDSKSEVKLPINEELLAEVLSELEKLRGLGLVKKDVREMVKLAKYYNEIGENIREKFSSHILFLGSPGTGKTTVARIVSKIYAALAILPGGQLIETDRSGLVASYVGQTAEKTTAAINSSIGGTLFIDEAYSLVKKESGGDFGKEAIDTLLKRMEDDRGKFIVIAAGYTEEMNAFLESNPGMKSRFTKTFFFEDYTPEDLLEIFLDLARKENLRLDENSKALLVKHFNSIYRNRDKNFGNARIVRNIYDTANRKRMLRLTDIPASQLTEEIKTFFASVDFDDIKPPEISAKPLLVKGDQDKLEIYLRELNKLTGLNSVKEGISKLVNSLKISQMRCDRGMEIIQKPLHSIFTGNPGTGKTTVARIVSNIYKELGVIAKGQLIEVDRAQLVAGYSGQTAIKTDEVINKALGGILFIDEAYTLARGGSDFGQEAIDTLLKRMEDYKGQFIVIAAGYTKEMQTFMEMNPGLTSRFVNTFHFEDYNPEELFNIAEDMARASGYAFDADCKKALSQKLLKIYDQRDKNFGNARAVRNILLEIISNQEGRITNLLNPSNDDLRFLTETDVGK